MLLYCIHHKNEIMGLYATTGAYDDDEPVKEKGYLERSLEQLVLGNYTEEVTALGTAGQIGLGLTGPDLPADIRDLSHDLKNWEWSWSHVLTTLLDGIGLFPLVGSLKTVDEVATLVKGVDKTSDVLKHTDETATLMKNTDELGSARKADDVIYGFSGAANGIKVKVTRVFPADKVNNWWKIEMGYNNATYKPGTSVSEIELNQDTTFVRVYDGNTSGQFGGWLMKAEDINGLTPAQIKDKFALPSTPAYVTDVKLPAGTIIRTGIVNTLEGWGNGGGIQFDLMGQRTGKFVNPRPLP